MVLERGLVRADLSRLSAVLTATFFFGDDLLLAMSLASALEGASFIVPKPQTPLVCKMSISHRTAVFARFAAAGERTVFPVDQNSLIAAIAAACSGDTVPLGA